MFKSKLHQIILCANAKQLVAGVWHADQLQQSERFLNNETGHVAFSNFLADHAETKILLISNALEEDYRVESLPHTSGNAKKELINRKLDQFYRGLTYRTAHFIMREKDKRKDDRFLFVALNNDDFLRPWMQIIQDTESQLVGVYGLPMLSRFLVKSFKLSAQHILLCEMLSTGLRQTYLHNGRLRMSRMIPNVPSDSKQLSYFYAVETQKTRLYLMSKRLIERDTILNVQLAGLAVESFSAIQASFQHEPGFECEVMPLAPLIKSQQLSQTAVKKVPELLHMQLLATGHQVDNLAPESLTKHFKLRRWSTLIKALALIIAIGAGLIGMWYLYQSMVYKNDYLAAQQATKLEQLKYNNVAAEFPSTKLSALDLQKAVKLKQQLTSLPKSPRHLMVVLANALSAIPNIKLETLQWQQAGLQTIIAKYPDLSTLKNNQALRGQNASLLTSGTMTAKIGDFDGDYRAANQVVEQLAAQLKDDAYVLQVKILQTPSNQNSHENLSGTTKDNPNSGLSFTEPDFALFVLLKPVMSEKARQ